VESALRSQHKAFFDTMLYNIYVWTVHKLEVTTLNRHNENCLGLSTR
jgi:hypothetical protein